MIAYTDWIPAIEDNGRDVSATYSRRPALCLCPGRLVNLLELVEVNGYAFVFANEYMLALREMERSGIWTGMVRRIDPFRLRFSHPVENPKDTTEALKFIQSMFRDCEMTICADQVDELLLELDKTGRIGLAACESMIDNIMRELKIRSFLLMPSAKQSKLFEEPFAGWESIIKRFPDSQDDIEEMNKCFALLRYKAAVFHSLLVIEYGLIDLGKYLGATDPKQGWDATYKMLERMVNSRASIPAGVDFNFVEQAKARVESIKHAWRNKVAHAAHKLSIEKTGFTEAIAEEIIMATRSFMRQLADGLP